MLSRRLRQWKDAEISPRKHGTQRRDIGHERRIDFAGLAQAFLQLLGTGTFQAAAVAAQRNISSFADPQSVHETLGQLLTQRGRPGAQDLCGQSGQSHLEAGQGIARPTPLLVTGHIESPRRGEAFALRIPATPRYRQHDPEQGLQRPPRSRLRGSPGPKDLLPKLGREIVGQGLLERPSRLEHEPFLPNGVRDNTHSVGKRLFQLRLGPDARPRPFRS